MKNTLNKEEALSAIFAGSILTTSSWDEISYINIENGQIVNNENEPFDISSTNINEWNIWEEPKAVKCSSLSKSEALSAMFAGKRVYTNNMSDGVYVYVDNGQVVQSDKKPFNIMQTDSDEWFIYEEKSNSNNDEVVKTLFKEIEKLNTEISTLKKTTKQDGRNTESQANTNELIKAVYEVTEPAEVKKLFREELQACKNKRDVQVAIVQAIPYCWIGGRTLGTTSVYYAAMRKIVKEVGGEFEDMSLALLVPPRGLYDASQAKVDASTKEKRLERDTYDIEYIKTIISKLKDSINTGNITKTRQQTQDRAIAYTYATYLAFVTGRRQVEILKTLKIVKKDDEWFYEGVAKKRNDENIIKAYSLDENFEHLNKLLQFIHKNLDSENFSKDQINQKFNNPFNNAFKKLTGTNFTFKDAREIMADMMWIESDENDGTWETEHEFKAKVLGHAISKERLTATESYMGKRAI
jgi:predicted house-cleaning noncanonical NTP pyrophosphatase (MazG superfamily)